MTCIMSSGVVNAAIELNGGGLKGGFSTKSPYFDFPLELKEEERDLEEGVEEVMWPAIKGASPDKNTQQSMCALPKEEVDGGITLPLSPIKGGTGADNDDDNQPQTMSRTNSRAISRSSSRAKTAKGSTKASSSKGTLSRSNTGITQISRMNTAMSNYNSFNDLNGDSTVTGAGMVQGLVCHESDFTTLKDPLELARRGMVEELRAILPSAGGLTHDGLNTKNELGLFYFIVCIYPIYLYPLTLQ